MEVPQAHLVLPEQAVSDLCVTGQDGCVTKTRLPDACVTGNNSGDSGQPDNSSLAWPSREAQRRHYENLLELTIPLRNTTR